VNQEVSVQQVQQALKDPQELKELLEPLDLQEILDLVVRLAQKE
jgi:hypothetical protein